MKKKKLFLTVICIVVVIVVVCAYVFSDYSVSLRINWNFVLPFMARYTEIYAAKSDSTINGDGIRYHVFSYKYKNFIDQMLMWSDTEMSTIFTSSYTEAAEAWLDEIDVPVGYRPDYDKCVYWYNSQTDSSEIIVFLNQDENLLYIVESIL